MKTLFLLLVIYLAYVVLKGFLLRGRLKSAYGSGAHKEAGGRHPGPRPGPVDIPEAEATVEDPVCGSFVPVSAAEELKTPKGMVYFCSAECRQRFIDSSGG